MTISRARRARKAGRRAFVIGAGVLALMLFQGAVSHADDIVKVEEDWQLVMDEPDLMTVSPQVTCTISPAGNLDSLYAVFDMNLRNFPSYEAGGVQLQMWNGESPVAAVRSNTGVVLQTTGETITWTQQMTLSDGQMSFAVVNGNSDTWGNFGDESSIALVGSTTLENLNAYHPDLSVADSGVGYGANRVVSLTLVEIRVYSAAGLVSQDTTPRLVYPGP